MTTIVTRAGKGSPLTFTEADANFTNLNTYKYESGDSPVFAAVTNGSVLTTGFASAYSYIIGMGATPVQWDNFGTTYGYQLGSNGFVVNQGNTYTKLVHGMRTNSSGNQVYTTTGVSPVWANLSGGEFSIYGAASGTAGDTISAVTPPFTVNCRTNTVLINNENVNSANGIMFRNRLINGDMRIDQRNAGAAVTTGMVVDRWGYDFAGTGAVSLERVDTGGPETCPYYVRTTVTTADASLGATDTYLLSQKIEGTNMADLDFGLSTAKSITISFWVRSSLTGTFSGSISNQEGAAGRGYGFTYTINSANTWEQKTVTITGDTGGTWPNTTSAWGALRFDLGSGSNYRVTAGSWTTATTQVVGVTSAVAVISTLSATFDLTGVQLEVGSVATPFERRAYGQELALCQRYYERFDLSNEQYLCHGQAYSALGVVGWLPFKVEKRIAPTGSDASAASTWSTTAANFALINASTFGLTIGNSTKNGARIDISVAGGLVAGNAAFFVARTGQTAYLGVISEF